MFFKTFVFNAVVISGILFSLKALPLLVIYLGTHQQLHILSFEFVESFSNPLLIAQNHVDLPVFSTTDLHCKFAFSKAISQT